MRGIPEGVAWLLAFFLIFLFRSVMIRAMFRFVILFVSIAWAALLLLSWSSPTETVAQPTPIVNNAS